MFKFILLASALVFIITMIQPVFAHNLSRNNQQNVTNRQNINTSATNDTVVNVQGPTNTNNTSIQSHHGLNSGGPLSPYVVQGVQSPATTAQVYDPRFPPLLPHGPVCVVHQPYGDIVRTDNFCAKAIN